MFAKARFHVCQSEIPLKLIPLKIICMGWTKFNLIHTAYISSYCVKCARSSKKHCLLFSCCSQFILQKCQKTQTNVIRLSFLLQWDLWDLDSACQVDTWSSPKTEDDYSMNDPSGKWLTNMYPDSLFRAHDSESNYEIVQKFPENPRPWASKNISSQVRRQAEIHRSAVYANPRWLVSSLVSF